jgi:hypothetical protein
MISYLEKRILAGEIEILLIQRKDPFKDVKILELLDSFNKLEQLKIKISYRLPEISKLYFKIKKRVCSMFEN